MSNSKKVNTKSKNNTISNMGISALDKYWPCSYIK